MRLVIAFPTMKFEYTVIAAAVAALLPALSAAQVPSPTPTTLTPITVTGSAIDDRFADSVSDPVSTKTFSSQQVEERHAKNLIEVLRSVAGITADLQGDGETIKIKLRGVENQRYMGEKPGVAIVVDGVPVFERTGKVNIDLDNIESIKVIKGGASYLYGEDALAGAVIITTKRGASNKGFKVETDAGSFGYRRALVKGGFATDDITGHVQYSDRDQEGYYYLSRTFSKTYSGNLKYAINGTSDLSLGFENSKRFRDREGSVTGEVNAANDPTGANGGRGFSRNFNVDLSRYNLTYSNDLTDASNVLAVLYQYQDDTNYWSNPMRFTSTGAATSSVNDYSTFNDYGQVQRGVKTEYRQSFEDLAVMGGLELKRNTFENFNVALNSYRTVAANPATLVNKGTIQADDFTTESTVALYGETKLNLSRDTAATLNARYDRITIGFDAKPVSGNGNKTVSEGRDFHVMNYRTGLSHALSSSTSMFGAISTGFRAPTAEQLYRGQTTTSALIKSNPDLEPEKALNFELGIKHKAAIFGWESSFNATVFQLDRRDFILDSNGQYSATGTTTGGGSQFRNIGGTRSRGLELELTTQPHHKWDFDVAYTYLDAVFTQYDNYYQSLGNPNGTFRNTAAAAQAAPGSWAANYTVVAYNNTGKQVPRTPPHQLTLRARYAIAPGWTAGAEVDYKATSFADEINQERLPGRTLLNLSAQYNQKIAAWKGSRLTAFVGVENVADQRYYITSRGTGDANFDGKYDSLDPSIVPDTGRVWRAGLSVQF